MKNVLLKSQKKTLKYGMGNLITKNLNTSFMFKYEKKIKTNSSKNKKSIPYSKKLLNKPA